MSDNRKKLFYIAAGATLIMIFALLMFFSLLKSNDKTFTILTTKPTNLEQQTMPGESEISFTTDKAITSSTDLTIEITPPINGSLKLVSKLPSNNITYQVLGGLLPNTTYSVKVTNTNTNKQTTWSFTTSNAQPESSTAQFNEEQKQAQENFFPLLEHVPVDNDRYHLTYTDKLTLTVKIKKNDVENIKNEVVNWIKSYGIDPSTHKIIYENAF